MPSRSSTSVLAAALLLGSPLAAVASGGGLRGAAAAANATLAEAAPQENLTESILGADVSGDAAAVATSEMFLNTTAAEEDMPNASLDANAEWRRHHHHHHHSASSSGGVMTLYHTTSPEIAKLILASGFKPGSSGWCGGAIYFTDTPHLKATKFGPDTKTGAIIEAKVNMGKVAKMGKRCDSTFGRGISKALRHGYDSLVFNPGDGDEYVIASASRVVSMRRYK